MRKGWLILIVLMGLPSLAEAQTQYDIFDKSIAEIKRKRAVDQGILATGVVVLLAGMATTFLPLVLPQSFEISTQRLMSTIGLSGVGIGVTLILGGGIAWGVHNNQIVHLLEKETKYRRLQ